jgi:ELWxxDGT repeat protein
VTDGTDAGTRPLDADCARRRGCSTYLVAVSGEAALLERIDTDRQVRQVARLDEPGVRPVPELGEGPAVASGDGFLVAGDLLARLAADGSVLESMGLPGRRDGDAEPRSLIALGERLVFTACDGERQRIYWTDGTPEAVVPLADGASSCLHLARPVPPLGLAGAVVVDAKNSIVRIDEAGNALPILDSYAAAVVPVGDALTVLVESWERTGEGLFEGRWLTKVFVSPGGAGPASEVATLPIAPFLDHLALGDRLFIADPSTAEGLFAFRPSAGGDGLEPIRCPAGGEVCEPGELAALGDVAFLLAGGLWRIDGNAATRIAPPAGAPGFFGPSDLVVFDGALYFMARSQGEGDGRAWLYRSDGSESGTVALAPIGDFYGEIDFHPLGLDGKLYFTAATPELGAELWVSDGTAAGTHPFLDLQEGAPGSRPLLLSVAAGRLFFAADDGEHGVELWSTDGVAAHTAMVADIAPGPLSAWPGRPVLAGGTLYFAAEDEIAGSELWAVPVAP